MDFLERIFGKRTPQSSTQRDEPRALAAAQPKQTILFAFFVRATGGPRVISTSSQEAWVKRLRDALELPKAQVTMFQENQWDAPRLDSVDDKAVQKNLVKIRSAIHKALIRHGVPAAVLNDLTSDIVKLSNPLTGLVVFVVKYTGDLPSASKTARVEYFEVMRPSGDGLCSDDNCPCGIPGARIPRGEGYLVISEGVIEFRRDARSIEESKTKVLNVQAKGVIIPHRGKGVVTPILCCGQSPKLNGLDRRVAAADAKHWWKTGLAPLRATPRT